MEHAVSEFLVDRIDEYLGHPAVDPHGDPIPAADGRLRGRESTTIPLNLCVSGQRVQVSRVMNQRAEFLRYLSEEGLAVGTVATVAANKREAGIVELLVIDRRISIGHAAAADLLVALDDQISAEVCSDLPLRTEPQTGAET